jgi:hypothetical protein
VCVRQAEHTAQAGTRPQRFICASSVHAFWLPCVSLAF